MNKKLRQKVKEKYNGLCAYSGTPLEDDWQIDHFKPLFHYEIGLEDGDPNALENLMPTQKLINHYKRGLSLDEFRKERMCTLHKRLAALPKNPRTERSKKRNAYMRKVASYFKITEDRPFCGLFFFETVSEKGKG